MQQVMQVEVRYFAAAREATGKEVEHVELPEGATVAALADVLTARHAGLADLRSNLRFAVGEHFAEPGRHLAAGDVVALLPPVSGG